MKQKELAIQAIAKMPDAVSYDDMIEALRLLETIENGLHQADNGPTIPHDQVVANLAIKLKAQSKLRELRGKVDWQGDLEKMRLDD